MDNVQLNLLEKHPILTIGKGTIDNHTKPASISFSEMQSWVVVGEMENPKSAQQSHYGTKKNAQISLDGRISKVG
ncbi:MAG TPA: hypothetical protein V6D11_24895 [Waterburya sp.]|jgi:hypothetical protein